MFEILIALLVWGGGIEPRLILDIQEEVAEMPDLPPSWEGERIAVVGDWQVGMWLGNTGMAGRAVRTLVSQRPAAVLIVGDFIYDVGDDPTAVVERAADLARPLVRAGIPTFAVLGNHDYGLDEPGASRNDDAAGLLIGRLEETGVVVLRNEAATLHHPRPWTGVAAAPPDRAPPPLHIVGIGSRYAEEADPSKALDDVPFDAPRLVFMHHPRTFREIPAWNAPVAFAGHRHGGQFRIPILNVSLLELFGLQADGWADEDFGKPGNRLYVNRGIGMSWLPIRINSPPEVTVFVLRRGGDQLGFEASP